MANCVADDWVDAQGCVPWHGSDASTTERKATDAWPYRSDGWWLVHTKSRNEKALAANLDRKGIQYFLPLARVRRRTVGRQDLVQVPLFPGYLFLSGGDEDRYATLMTHRAANVIKVTDQDTLNAQLKHVQQMMASEAPLDLYPGIRPGKRCRVVAGALEGIEGVVLRRRGVCRVYVEVEVLGQSAEMEVDPSFLELVG